MKPGPNCPMYHGEGVVYDMAPMPLTRDTSRDELLLGVADLLAALKAIGIEPPEWPGEPWSVLLNENGPEEGGDTAEDTAQIFMDYLTRRDGLAERAEARLARLYALPKNDAAVQAGVAALREGKPLPSSDSEFVRCILRAALAAAEKEEG